MLAQALITLLESIPAPALALSTLVPALMPAQPSSTLATQLSGIQNEFLEGQALWEKITSIDACLIEVQTNIEVQMGDVISMLGRIFVAIKVDKTMTLR